MAEELKQFGVRETQKPRALWKMTIIADVHAHPGITGLEDRVAEIAGLEKVLLPEAARVWDVALPVFPEEASVGVEESGGVVIDAGLLAFVDGDHHRHLVLFRVRLHPLRGGAWDGLSGVVPEGVLARAEVRAAEDRLAENLHPLLARLLDEREVLRERRGFDRLDGRARVEWGRCGP